MYLDPVTAQEWNMWAFGSPDGGSSFAKLGSGDGRNGATPEYHNGVLGYWTIEKSFVRPYRINGETLYLKTLQLHATFHPLEAQQGSNNPFKWEDADNIGDLMSAGASIPALAGGIAEYEIVNELVRNAQKDYYTEAIKSISKYNKVVRAAGKVLGITGVVTSFGELVTEDFSWTNLTKFGINVAGLAIKANPLGLTVSLTIGLIDATGYLDKGLNYIYNENTSQ